MDFLGVLAPGTLGVRCVHGDVFRRYLGLVEFYESVATFRAFDLLNQCPPQYMLGHQCHKKLIANIN